MIQKRGVPAVPSDSIPFPLVGEPYFNGGYNTVRFGSKNGGTIDAIQIESHQGVRFDYNKRVVYADSLAEAILEYVEKQETQLGEIEQQKSLLSNTFFKDNKDTASITLNAEF
jgi:hypothetical protein